MVEFQASGEAVLEGRAQIPHRAVTLTLNPRESHTLPPWPLAVVRKESVNVIGRWVLRVGPACICLGSHSQRAMEAELELRIPDSQPLTMLPPSWLQFSEEGSRSELRKSHLRQGASGDSEGLQVRVELSSYVSHGD